MQAVMLRTTIATLVAFTGGLLGIFLGRIASRHLNLLIYAATGALLAVTVCDVLPDAKQVLTWPVFLAASASGYALLWLIGKYVSPVCPSCALSAFDEATTQRLRQTVVFLMVALGIHSTMDGIAVVVGDQIAGRANLGILFAISLHKLPEGMALALLLLGAGFTRRTALGWTLGIETTTELGALVGVLALRGASIHWLGLLFAHVGGGFLYLVLSTFGAFTTHQDRLSTRSMVAVSSLAFLLTSSLLWTVSTFIK
jgi:ZIP family zinc transporter